MEIDINFWKGNRSSCTSNLKWPRQIQPSQQCWTIWRSTLHLLITKSPKSNRLDQGHYCYHWLSHSPSHQRWPTFIDSFTLLLYSRHPGSPNTNSIYFLRHRFSHTLSGTSTHLLPTNSVPITVSSWTLFAVSTLFHHKQASPTATPTSIHTTTNITHTHSFNILYSNQAMSPPNPHPSTEQLSTALSSLPANISVTYLHSVLPYPHQFTTHHTLPCKMSHKALHAFITSLPLSEQYFLGCYIFPPSIQHFISDIHSNKFTMASDGSVQAPNGSFAWVIYGIKSETHWSGHNTIAKGHSDLSSFHTDACGYLGALFALRALLKAFLPPANFLVYTTIHINNLGVVQRSSDTPFSIQQCLLPDWDIFNEATKVRHSIPGVIKVQHVKSHQDNNTNTPWIPPLPARLNILADAGTHQAYTGCLNFCQTPFLPSTPVALVINCCLIRSYHLSSALLAYYTPIMSKYFKEKHCWSGKTFHSIDWQASNKEYKQLPTGRQLASFKLQNGLWPTYSVLHQRKPTRSPTFPRCCLCHETHKLVICFSQAQTTWLQQCCIVETAFKSALKTPSPIYGALVYGIKS